MYIQYYTYIIKLRAICICMYCISRYLDTTSVHITVQLYNYSCTLVKYNCTITVVQLYSCKVQSDQTKVLGYPIIQAIFVFDFVLINGRLYHYTGLKDNINLVLYFVSCTDLSISPPLSIHLHPFIQLI